MHRQVTVINASEPAGMSSSSSSSSSTALPSASTFVPYCCGCMRALPPGNNNGFVLSCGEFLCGECAQRSGIRGGTLPECPSCAKRNVNTISLNGPLPTEVSKRMTDPATALEEYRSTLQFQVRYYKNTLNQCQKRFGLQNPVATTNSILQQTPQASRQVSGMQTPLPTSSRSANGLDTPLQSEGTNAHFYQTPRDTSSTRASNLAGNTKNSRIGDPATPLIWSSGSGAAVMFGEPQSAVVSNDTGGATRKRTLSPVADGNQYDNRSNRSLANPVSMRAPISEASRQANTNATPIAGIQNSYRAGPQTPQNWNQAPPGTMSSRPQLPRHGQNYGTPLPPTPNPAGIALPVAASPYFPQSQHYTQSQPQSQAHLQRQAQPLQQQPRVGNSNQSTPHAPAGSTPRSYKGQQQFTAFQSPVPLTAASSSPHRQNGHAPNSARVGSQSQSQPRNWQTPSSVRQSPSVPQIFPPSHRGPSPSEHNVHPQQASPLPSKVRSPYPQIATSWNTGTPGGNK